ncbi:MAG: hypothetical protein AB9869_01775 [Verrucomicrobiia bacterium]
MRAIIVFALGSALLLGCRTPKPTEPREADAPQSARQRAAVTPPRAAQQRPTTSAPAVTPVTESAGRVASVNPALRFVVIDFAFNPAPRVDERMAVYRQGQKVGEVKISRQARNSIIAADITTGDVRVGDEVRPE